VQAVVLLLVVLVLPLLPLLLVCANHLRRSKSLNCDKHKCVTRRRPWTPRKG
jgi:hypothetical protein